MSEIFAELWKYMEMGAFHILDIGGIDHLLFIASLVIVYSLVSWRQVLLLLTAFTIGHAIALLIVATDLMTIPKDTIEFLIPLTILFTAVIHLWRGRTGGNWLYYICVLFGLIHGSAYAKGFSSLFRKSSDIILPTVGFNLGVELGQAVFGFVLLALLELFCTGMGLARDKTRVFIFGVIIALAVQFVWANRIW